MDLNQTTQTTEPKKYSAILKWSLIIGIVIVINLFFNYAISLVYEAPQYSNYCKQEQVIEAVTTKDACLAKGGQWNENIYKQPVAVGETPAIGYCDLQFTCNQDFQTVNKIYERNIFVTLVVLGIILVAGSFALSFNWILSVSASLGGILSIIIASMRYWSEADNWLRVLILFVALMALIYFAVRKFNNQS
jgi:hypothetical protein